MAGGGGGLLELKRALISETTTLSNRDAGVEIDRFQTRYCLPIALDGFARSATATGRLGQMLIPDGARHGRDGGAIGPITPAG